MTSWRMQPTGVSALGVIAIVSVMITLATSVADSSQPATTPSPSTKEEPTTTNPSNSTINPFPRTNDTSSDLGLARTDIPMNLTDIPIVDLQGDQSDDRHALSEYTEAIEKMLENVSEGSKTVTETSTELATKLDLTEVPKQSDLVSHELVITSSILVEETTRVSVTTELLPTEQKTVEDIRAISFQVPPKDRKTYEDSGKSAGKSEAKKEQSRGLNNILASGKSTKAFYEIKPSIKTEMEGGQERHVTVSSQTSIARKFLLPSVDSAIGKYGPYFEDGDEEMNITARIGSTVLLDCKIGMLGDKEVTWLQHSKDSFRLLTVGRKPYSNDQRISLKFRYPGNWRLQILYASPRDSGLYKCQVATHPPLIKEINVIVTAPELTITDDSGRLVSKERHLKAGSALKLRCEARDVLESLEESVIWTRGDETLTEDVSENRTSEMTGDKEILIIVSTLTVERATPRHAGNYSCVVPDKTKTSIAVHVLNGELPAAVHDGNGVSRAFLNLWLIHLTMSYIFSR